MTTRDVMDIAEGYALMPRQAQEVVNLLYHHDDALLFAGRYKRLRPIDQYAVTDWLEDAVARGLHDAQPLLDAAREYDRQHPDPGRVDWVTLSLDELDAQRRAIWEAR